MNKNCNCYRCKRRFPGKPPCPFCQESTFVEQLFFNRKLNPSAESRVLKPLHINNQGQVVTVEKKAKVFGRKVSKDDVNQTCSICMTNYAYGQEIYETSCSHKFHCLCVQRWFVIEKTCPECRTIIQTQEESASLDSSMKKLAM